MWRSAVQVCLGLLIGESQCSKGFKAWDYKLGGLAQLARAPALQAGGQRFESVILHRVDGHVIRYMTMNRQTIFDMLLQTKL